MKADNSRPERRAYRASGQHRDYDHRQRGPHAPAEASRINTRRESCTFIREHFYTAIHHSHQCRVIRQRKKCGGIRNFSLWLSKKFVLRVSYGILGFGVHVPRPYPLTTSPPPHSPSHTTATRDHLNLPDTLSSLINPLREPKSTSSVLCFDLFRIPYAYSTTQERKELFVRAC